MRIVEVGLRDGLQSVEAVVPTGAKVEIVHALIEAGVRDIEAVSFAHPKVIPQLADAEAVMSQVPRIDGVTYRGLVPNLRGAERAAGCGLDEMLLVVAADEETSLRNQRRTVDQMMGEIAEVSTVAHSAGAEFLVAVACAFFAPARGPVPAEECDRVVDAAVEAGAEGVYLAGTSGMEHPLDFARGIARTRERHPDLAVGVHLHNRNGFAMANALAAMGAGAQWLECSFAGLGGDPWFPGDVSVLGNAPTEDVLHLCESVGVETGIDLAAYLGVVARVETLTGRSSTSYVTRGGTRTQLADAQWPD
jgi:hydroxymethylglutaryl-CoA lyase